MRRFLLAIILLATIQACAEEPLKTWSYESLKNIWLSFSKGSNAAMRVNQSVMTPDGERVLEVEIKEISPEVSQPYEIQLNCSYDGGLKAGSYELSFLCKGSAPGELRVSAGLAEKPWSELPGAASTAEVSKDWQRVSLIFNAQKDFSVPLHIPRIMLAKYGSAATLYFGPMRLSPLPKMLPLSLNREWSLFLGAKEPKFFASLPEELSGVKARTVSLQGNSLNLAALAGSFKEKDCAMLYNQFDSAEAGRMRVGVAADWWLELYVNGERVYSNIPDGNDSHEFTPDDHVVDIPVKPGRNLLAAKVISGAEGWRFVCGEATRTPDGLLTIRQGSSWKAIDMDSLAVKAGTALDFSSLLGKRRPAGELGRLFVNPAGRLAFEKEPGKPVRFLSFNTFMLYWRLDFYAWTKSDIDDFANAVARQGYNMIRFQTLEKTLIGYNIYKLPRLDITETRIPQKPEELQFDPGCVDRFDYLLAALKRNGVYVNLDLMTASTGYSMAFKSQAADSFRIQLFFNQEYRRHWEMTTKYLLAHVNPYTGLALKDDPAIANLEPYNEQELLLYVKDYMRAFTPHFRQMRLSGQLGRSQMSPLKLCLTLMRTFCAKATPEPKTPAASSLNP